MLSLVVDVSVTRKESWRVAWVVWESWWVLSGACTMPLVGVAAGSLMYKVVVGGGVCTLPWWKLVLRRSESGRLERGTSDVSVSLSVRLLARVCCDSCSQGCPCVGVGTLQTVFVCVAMLARWDLLL